MPSRDNQDLRPPIHPMPRNRERRLSLRNSASRTGIIFSPCSPTQCFMAWNAFSMQLSQPSSSYSDFSHVQKTPFA